jgi:RNA polymerase sigma-70 factor (ECF subfamily)
MPNHADPHLIDRAKRGDTDAISKLYECHQVGIYRYFYYRTGDTQVADDLTSETFLRMINSLSGYQYQGVAFQAWLFQIARNLLNDYYRKMGVRNDTELEENIMEDPHTPSSRPVEHALNSVMLQKALNELSVDQRDVIVMRFITGMPISEVAQALDRSEDAVKGLQRRALATLRDVLADWEVQYA